MNSYPRTIPLRAIESIIATVAVVCVLAGCVVMAEKPVFGPQDSVKIEGMQGEYFLYDPAKKDLNEEIVASVSDGELEIVNLKECSKAETCFWKAVVVRLPASNNSYAVQILEDANKDEAAFVFLQRFGNYGLACGEIDDDGLEQQLDRLRHLALASGLEVESRYKNPLFITGNPEPEPVLRLLDETWSKLPRSAWTCYGLIPEVESVDGIESIMNRTSLGSAREN